MPYEHALLYIQILLAVLLFALGIPALIVEASVEGRLRHLLHKRLPYRVVTILLILTVGVVISLLYFARSESHDNSVSIVDVVTKSATSLLIAGFAILWWMMMRHDVQTALVYRIRKRLERRLRWRGHYREEDLRDLVAVGAEAAAGHEKHVVIDALRRIIRTVQSSKDYDGTVLTPFIHGFFDAAASRERPGDDSNLLQCIEALRQTWLAMSTQFRQESDGLAITEVACLMGEHAVEIRSDAVSMHSLSIIDDNCELPFRVGRAAVTAGRYRVAVACLSRLEAIAARTTSIPKELIGLIAHFRSGGKASRARAMFAERGIDAETIFRAASEYAEENEFATSDEIHAYAAAVSGPRRDSRLVGGIALAATWSAFALAAMKRRGS